MIAEALFVMLKKGVKAAGMHGLLSVLWRTSEFKSLSLGLERGLKSQSVFGLSGSQRSYLIGGLTGSYHGPVLVVTSGDAEAHALVDELKFLLANVNVYQFPTWQLLPFQVMARDQEIPARRLKVLEAFSKGEKALVVAPVEALLRQLSPPDMFKNTQINFKVGERVDLEKLKLRLLDYGYECVNLIEGRGQFSSRGAIIDIFPVTFDRPLRMEFFDDEIDSIRFFDFESQRSEENIKEISFYAAAELVLNEGIKAKARKKIEFEYRKHFEKLQKAGSADAAGRLTGVFQTIIRQLTEGTYSIDWENFLPYFYSRPFTLLDYLPPNSLIIVDDPLRIKKITENIHKERSQTYTDLLISGKLSPNQLNGYVDWQVLSGGITNLKVVYLSFLSRQTQNLYTQNEVTPATKTMRKFLGKSDILCNEIRNFRKKGYAVIIITTGKESAHNLQQILRDAQIDSFVTGSLEQEIYPGNVVITLGCLAEGFEFISGRLAVITENDIYSQWKKSSREFHRPSKRMKLFADLKVGDYVVHMNHGIGRYKGIVSLNIGGIQKDYLLVQYAGEDKLYVPTDQVGFIQKYLGSEAEAPKLSRLGGNEWSRVKGRVKEAVREMAIDLLALYAARQRLPGYAFAPDTVWQHEFEAAFPYEETQDQLRTVEEVKTDMERNRPMDRLLCGDVGYGKTEVALRAAFKAIASGKQVAVLVPTTILAHQHYTTFKERFNGFPVKVEMLSRFRSPREQQQIISALKEGKVDIVIGTHRLVQKDMIFNDLGLVVVDEEQRFGVAHKEKLKKLREDVDVLTLTATPIPRTLHMSMVGVRDTSVLETPPEDRFPVQTYVLEEDPVLIREAIRREIGRGGQVYFVYNRVMDLYKVAAWLQGLVHEARIAVAHGQMREDELEQVMFDFISGQYDILVCTTIIENGMDISNVNTLIVKDAQKLGLAQLYQLRGRVGRSNRLAYAYFTFPRNQALSEVAEKRLAAIREFTEFGSGYKIAMRDLEIRGAGNLLGPEQHGHIAAVGFDLYCRLLEEAVKEAKGEPVKKPVETSVELPVEAFIPNGYIPDSDQKVDIYRRLASIRKLEEIFDMEEELIDRYGDLPKPVRNLLIVARLKVLASLVGIKNVAGQAGGYRLQFHPEHSLSGENLVAIGRQYQNLVKFSNNEGFEIRLKTKISPANPEDYLANLEDFLRLLNP